jgi:acyl-coenzyme A thioesterase PaaI-like protein
VKKIENIFEQDPQFNCFGCAHKNDTGLKLEFFYDEDAEEVFSITTLGNQYASFTGIVHGGIISTVMDDIAFWTMFQSVKKFALTTKMETEFKQPVRPNTPLEGKITLISKVNF